jgi:hypothetical protein
MTDFSPGDTVRYDGDLPDGVYSEGYVHAVDESMDQIVTVHFGCLTQDIPASELRHA